MSLRSLPGAKRTPGWPWLKTIKKYTYTHVQLVGAFMIVLLILCSKNYLLKHLETASKKNCSLCWWRSQYLTKNWNLRQKTQFYKSIFLPRSLLILANYYRNHFWQIFWWALELEILGTRFTKKNYVGTKPNKSQKMGWSRFITFTNPF